ncbi:hypothetical protein [Streptomyces sp. NPDC091217]|uniref:hypothetical protein n=1 Tax=Streptomyces sp. NPDC091217 TaxID=3365975 RepID=UPI0037F88BAD
MYAPILDSLGLSVDAIKNYNLPELELALTRINEAISHPEQFGTISATSQVKFWVVEAGPEVTIGILPFLLERKRLILDRIQEMRSEEQLGGLQDLIERLPAGPEKEALKKQLAALETEAAAAREQDRAAAKADSAAQARVVEGWQKERKAKEKAEDKLKEFREKQLFEEEMAERKWKRRVAREPIATIVGAILLVALTGVFMVSMFLKLTPSTLLSNSFLIILGYFFGQSTSSPNGAPTSKSAGPSNKRLKKNSKNAEPV